MHLDLTRIEPGTTNTPTTASETIPSTEKRNIMTDNTTTQTGFFGPTDIAEVTSGEPHNSHDAPIASFAGQIGSYDEGDLADVFFIYTPPTADDRAEIEISSEFPGGLDEDALARAHEVVYAVEDLWQIITETADTLYAVAGDPDHIVTPEEIAAALRSEK